MNWTKEILDEVTEFAKLPQFTPGMIARAVGIPEDEFLEAIEDSENPLAMAYDKGQLLSKAELDKKVIQLSNQGSGPAHSLNYKMRRDTQYYKLLDHYGK